MLTESELALIATLGECAQAFVALINDDFDPHRRYFGMSESERDVRLAVHEGDLAEFIAHVHDLQHAVMARAARRSHPEHFHRLRQPVTPG
jgi:hypothetical protein